MLKHDMSIALLHYLTKYVTPVVVILINGVICTSLLIVACIYLRNRRLCKSPVGALPGIQIPFYNLLFDIAREYPSYSTMKKLSLPPTAYLQAMCSGVTALYPDKKTLVIKAGFQTIILLVKAESVQEFYNSGILITPAFGELLRPLFGNGLFLSVGRRWKARRKLLNPVFHNDIIKEIVPVFDEEAKILVDILRRKHHEPWTDVAGPISLCTMDIICKAFLGLNFGAQKKCESEFINAAVRISQTVVKRIMNPLYQSDLIFAMSALGQQFQKDINSLRAIATQALRKGKEERKLQNEKSAEDGKMKPHAMYTLFDFENHLGIGEEEVRDELLSFIYAGTQSTISALSFALYLIGLHPEIQNKIFEEIDIIYGSAQDKEITPDDLKEMVYLECVLKESQRLYPAGPLMGKHVMEDFTFSDYKVNKGDIIVVDTHSLHRDPDVFPNPEVFDPERFLPEKSVGRNPNAYVPFSGGVRHCPGSHFAMMEMKTVVANILHKFLLTSAKPRDKINTSYELVLRSCEPLNLKFTPRYISDKK